MVCLKPIAVILTFNEERHLERCIASLRDTVSEVVVVDSFSTDCTVEIAKKFGARVLQNHWVNHASQFNWALTQLSPETGWVLRIDADEVITEELTEAIVTSLPAVSDVVSGIFVDRKIIFQGRLLRFGGLGAQKTLRLFRYGRGHCEKRWMDEHLKVAGQTVEFRGALIDDNLNSLTWWTDKHNKYASLEAIDLLNLEFRFMPIDSIADLHGRQQVGMKRWVKEKIYARLPGGIRAVAYFIYRYVFRLGFLDGRQGSHFHVLQGFWYRYLVDGKVSEVRRYMEDNGCDCVTAIEQVLGIKLQAP